MSINNIGVILFAALVGCAGLALLTFGLWPRRRGTTPYCRGCSYQLTGLTSDRCPECGRLLADRGIVHGETKRAPLAVGFATILLIICGLATVGIARRFDVYPYLPTLWLISFNLQSSNRATIDRTWAELMQREANNQLSAHATNMLIERGLTSQAAKPRQAEVDFLGLCELKGRLTPEQAEKFFGNMVQVTLVTRKRVRAGDQLPYHVEMISRGPRSFTCTLSLPEISTNGVHKAHELSMSSGVAVRSRGGFAGQLPISELGKHQLAVVAEVTINDANQQRLHTSRHELVCEFEVVPPDRADGINRVHDPALTQSLHKAFRIREVALRRDGNWKGTINFETGRLPCALAFDVIARVNGREYPAGTLTQARGEAGRGSQSFNVDRAVPLQDTVDILLRGSERAARETTDLMEYWDGELVYEAVSVQRPDTAPARTN